MKLKYILLSTLAMFLSLVFVSSPAQAKEIRTNSNINVAKSETIDSSLTATGSKINIEGVLNGNLYCSGQDVVISGKINGSIYCMGSKINLTGRVDGDVFAVASNINIAGPINGSANIFASSVTLQDQARIRQDLSVIGSNATINGLVARDVDMSVNSARIGAIIGRNLSGNFGSLELTSDADVRGDVKYSSGSYRQDSGARVNGKVIKNQSMMNINMSNKIASAILAYFVALLSLLVVSLVTVLVFPRFYDKTTSQINERAGQSIGWGFFNTLVVPVASGLLLLTIIGIPLAGLILTAWVLSLMLSGPIFAYFVGSKIVKDKKKHFVIMLVGSLVVLALYIVPIVNIILGLIVAVVGSGSLFSVFKSSKYLPKKA